jgi:hypothetical protein
MCLNSLLADSFLLTKKQTRLRHMLAGEFKVRALGDEHGIVYVSLKDNGIPVILSAMGDDAVYAVQDGAKLMPSVHPIGSLANPQETLRVSPDAATQVGFAAIFVTGVLKFFFFNAVLISFYAFQRFDL